MAKIISLTLLVGLLLSGAVFVARPLFAGPQAPVSPTSAPPATAPKAVEAGATPVPLDGTIYLLAAFPADQRQVEFQAALYAVDQSKNIRLVQAISDPVKGVEAVSLDDLSRTLVITAPAIAPTTAYVIKMHVPQSVVPVGINVSSTLSVVAQNIVGLSGSSSLFTVMIADNGGASSLLGVNLSSLGNPPSELTPMPWSIFSGVRVYGSTGVGEIWSDADDIMSISANGAVSLESGVTLDFPAPPTLHTQSSSIVFLNADNEFLALLSNSIQISPNPSGLGFRTDYIYNKTSRAWKELTVPGSVSWARASGPWLLYVVAEPSKTEVSPGSKERASLDLPVGDLISNSGVYLPGKIFAYDSRSGESYSLETGQGDTEPLFMDGQTLYYRVNNSLLMTTVQNGSFGSSVLLATAPALSQAHWGFLGPSLGN